MALTLMYDDKGEYLLVRVLGDWDSRDLLSAIDAASSEMRTRGRDRALIDVRSLTDPPLLVDHYVSAKCLAEQSRGRRIALIAREGQLKQLGVAVALDRGLDLVVDTDADAATDWLLRKPA